MDKKINVDFLDKKKENHNFKNEYISLINDEIEDINKLDIDNVDKKNLIKHVIKKNNVEIEIKNEKMIENFKSEQLKKESAKALINQAHYILRLDLNCWDQHPLLVYDYLMNHLYYFEMKKNEKNDDFFCFLYHGLEKEIKINDDINYNEKITDLTLKFETLKHKNEHNSFQLSNDTELLIHHIILLIKNQINQIFMDKVLISYYYGENNQYYVYNEDGSIK